MASLVCLCARGGDLWGEFWWVGREYKWVFFDDDNTSARSGDLLGNG
jgi:hypothetical protein